MLCEQQRETAVNDLQQMLNLLNTQTGTSIKVETEEVEEVEVKVNTSGIDTSTGSSYNLPQANGDDDDDDNNNDDDILGTGRQWRSDRHWRSIRRAMVRADRLGVLDSHPVMVQAAAATRELAMTRRKRRQIRVVLQVLLSDISNAMDVNNSNNNNSTNNSTNNSLLRVCGGITTIDTLTQTLSEAAS